MCDGCIAVTEPEKTDQAIQSGFDILVEPGLSDRESSPELALVDSEPKPPEVELTNRVGQLAMAGITGGTHGD